MIRPGTHNVSATVEMTPIIDLVFLLLIFFLVATTFHQTEREMKIVLPQASSAGPIATGLREIIVNVDDAGRIYVSGNRIELDGLRQLVERAVAANPQQKVTVRGDRNAAYGNVARVLDICKAAGIQEPFLDTVPYRGGN